MYKLILVTILFFCNHSFAKSKCPNEWNALKEVQNKLRKQSSSYLRDKEHKLHKIYQDCRKGKNKKIDSYYVKKKNSSSSSSKQYPKYNLKQPEYSGTIKGLFEGEKQDAWLNYYKRPRECLKPKTTQQFSKCLNHRDEEATKFNKIWLEIPPPIKIGTH